MSSENSDKNEGGQKLGLFIFDCFMSVIYLVLSITFLFTSLWKNWPVPDGVKIGLGILFGLYGIFRVTMVTKRMIQRNR